MSAALARMAEARLLPVPARPAPAGAGAADVERRGRELLLAQGMREPGDLAGPLPEALSLEPGFARLLEAVESADPGAARAAGLLLTGLGPGLTPLGDDLLIGAAAAMTALGVTAGLPAAAARRWTAALAGAARAGRTTPLSGELLALACRGRLVPPLAALLDLSAGGSLRWRDALAALGRIGSSSGRGWSVAAASASVALAKAGKPARTVGIFPMTARAGRSDTGLEI